MEGNDTRVQVVYKTLLCVPFTFCLVFINELTVTPNPTGALIFVCVGDVCVWVMCVRGTSHPGS